MLKTTFASRRLRIIFVGLIVIMMIFVGRLFYLQVIRHDYYVEQARAIQVKRDIINPERGQIYARDGQAIVPMVLNETVYTIFADPAEITSPDKVVATVSRLANGHMVSGQEVQLTNKQLRYVPLAKQVSRTQAEAIRNQKLAGVGVQATERRVYPEGTLAAQLLGYVDSDGQGQYGLEGALQSRLVGTPGRLEAIADVRRIPLTIGDQDVSIPAQHGDDLVLTVDRNVQAQAEKLLHEGLDRAKAKTGSILVMDPRSGNVLAMANWPTYNPAQYSKVDNYGIFQNRVVSSPYEAGSVIKPLTMSAGLDTGAVAPDSTFNNTGSVKVDDRVIRNVLQNVNNPRSSMLDTFLYSLNTGVVHVLTQMGGGQINRQARDKLYHYFHDQYRLGQKTGIEQSGESPGIVIAPDQQEGNNVRYANMTFGQGMDVTMLQVASAFSAAINGGNYYQPRLVGGTMGDDGRIGETAPRLVTSGVVSVSTSEKLREMVHQARVKGPFAAADKRGYYVGGKTGTSQIIDPKTGQYIDTNAVGTYLGFGGATTTPEYVIMVRVDDSQLAGYSGSMAAGPIFNDMSNWIIDYLQLRPAN